MRVDLHLHSKFSGVAAEWLLRRVGVPGSYSEPAALYERARARGMDAFTLTDRDSIEGCRSLAGRPGAFMSVEATARFPEDAARVRVLVWGITEEDFAAIEAARGDVYTLQALLAERKLAHAVAHPLHRVDDGMEAWHLEKLVLLFRHFEGANGMRDALTSAVACDVLQALSEEKMAELSARHGLAPTHERAWEKVLTGGSDDRTGLFVANAWTEAEAGTVPDFLAAVRDGRCKSDGAGGGPLAQAHGLYGALFAFASEKFAGFDGAGLVGKAFSRFMEGENPTEFSLSEKLGFLAQGIMSGQVFDLVKPRRASIWRQFAGTFRDGELKGMLAKATRGVAEPERRAFITACLFADRLLYRFFTSLVKKVSGGNPIDAMQDISLMAGVGLTLAPYFVAFRQLAPDRKWLGRVAQSLMGQAPSRLANVKRAWFTDTLEDVNGVATTIKRMTAACVENGHAITVVTSRADSTLTGIPLENFKPIGEFELPEYELQKLSFPPLLKMIDFIHREGFTELIISTPGPVGLTALLAARLLGLRTAGIYHTDIPQYVRILTEDRSWETLAWTFMRSFYSQMDTVWVNSESYRASWITRGMPAEKLRILPRGLDTDMFRTDRRDESFWQKRGARAGDTVLLYVGRMSKEKNLTLLAEMWKRIAAPGVAIAFVGDGPFLAELKSLVPGGIFTGYLSGEELAAAFASAEVFLFPSATDTFGNVIIEAQACGLPCVVSDQGGPKDLVRDGETGFVTRANNTSAFTDAVSRLLAEPQLRQKMSAAAALSVADRDWREAARRWWEATS